MKKILCIFGFHNYKLKKDTHKYHYLECKNCLKRKLKMMFIGGYQPIDQNWLNWKKY